MAAAYIHLGEKKRVPWLGAKMAIGRPGQQVRTLNSNSLTKRVSLDASRRTTHKLMEQQFMLANTGIVGPGSLAFQHDAVAWLQCLSLAGTGKIDEGRIE